MASADPLTLGEWSWDTTSDRLSVRADPGKGLDEIDGIWTLRSVTKVLDGLSQQRLENLFHASHQEGETVSCPLELSTGRSLTLAGTFDATGSARGVLMRSVDVGELQALALSGLEAVFQPIVSLKTGQIAGFEALARWPGGAGGNRQAPEVRGLAPTMLQRASDALSGWMKTSGRRDLFVNVNVTAPDLASEMLTDIVREIMSNHGYSTGQLRIELTEQAALRDPGQVLRTVESLKAARAGLILDDFGTGHSSFEWLEALPADGLKVDSDLVAKAERSRMQTILRSVTSLAHDLGMSTTAEGVERLESLSLLKSLGFDFVQGFAFSVPLPAEEAGELLLS
ncbi:MAG: hypothetical protein CME85_07860 [Henriciella sp.]|jgi:EAL domain-containing protein (putative c-di-GMP-specific phosphodiesterase class I)|uniref:EAL domain-containing protein n=1 Tax=Henriciella sp. TaxID=1968823 RepID=UPI000C1058A0|nr:EAL domain-containing protein [Henriciella sp.]MAN73824.1 hypothetical protein [Henriciella sp.]MBF35499.1 hypothetical protein [Hyphomonadaceae bacterium]MBK75398.1 hypothetical protein [Henriciella sp.]PHR82398.1 MAG: hypothetical protein COA64_01385 [Henriciella sp.]|tara:strand:- start:5417 stop:6439 length:1023 start_codon:yes stop_codon:yes gene_type:complete